MNFRMVADVRSMSNYYPYGMQIEAGSWSGGDYNYGYTGMLKESFDKNFLHYGARTHHTELGSFIKTDAMESQYPEFSPYIYAGNNPIAFFDELGLFPLTFHSRVFAPFDEFGYGFKGDGKDRSFTTDPTASSRLYSKINIETDNMQIDKSKTKVNGSDSEGPEWAFSMKKYSDAKQTFSVENQNTLKVHLYGSNKAFPIPTADIDLKAKLKVDVTKQKNGNQILKITGKYYGDLFPASEGLVSDDFGNSVFLGGKGVHYTSQEVGPYLLLPFDNDFKRFDVNIEIEVDSKGKFIGVLDKNRETIRIDVYNAKFENKSAVVGNAKKDE